MPQHLRGGQDNPGTRSNFGGKDDNLVYVVPRADLAVRIWSKGMMRKLSVKGEY